MNCSGASAASPSPRPWCSTSAPAPAASRANSSAATRAPSSIALDLAPGMLREARRHQQLWRRFERVCGDAPRLPLAGASVDLVFSSLMLQWCEPLGCGARRGAPRAQARRLLRLQHLRARHAAASCAAPGRSADGYNHVNHFVDVHDVGAALVRAGLTEPVLDVDRIEVDYPDTLALMRDLKAIGAHNVTAGRPRSLARPRAPGAHERGLRSRSAARARCRRPTR